MTLDIPLLISLISAYQQEPSDDLIKEFQEQIYSYVLRWLKLNYKCSEDISSDFVVYLLPFAGQIMQSYPPNLEASFSTWFSAVLVNKYSDFSKQGKVIQYHNNIDNYVEHISICSEDISMKSKKFDDVLKELSAEEKSIFCFFKYTEAVTAEDLTIIVSLSNKPLHEVLEIFQQICMIQEKNYTLKEIITSKINDLEHKIAHANNISKKHPHKKEDQEIKITHLENRIYKFQLQLKNLDRMSAKKFSGIFGDYQATYRKIRKIEYKLYKIMEKM